MDADFDPARLRLLELRQDDPQDAVPGLRPDGGGVHALRQIEGAVEPPDGPLAADPASGGAGGLAVLRAGLAGLLPLALEDQAAVVVADGDVLAGDGRAARPRRRLRCPTRGRPPGESRARRPLPPPLALLVVRIGRSKNGSAKRRRKEGLKRVRWVMLVFLPECVAGSCWGRSRVPVRQPVPPDARNITEWTTYIKQIDSDYLIGNNSYITDEPNSLTLRPALPMIPAIAGMGRLNRESPAIPGTRGTRPKGEHRAHRHQRIRQDRRNIFRAVQDDRDIEIVAVNDLTDPATLAHLLKHDSVSGALPGTVRAEGNEIVVTSPEGQETRVTVLSEREPGEAALGKPGRGDRGRVHRDLHRPRARREAPRRGRPEGHRLRPRQGRGPDGGHGSERGPLRPRLPPHPVERLLHHELPGPGGEGPPRDVRAQEGRHDHRPLLHERPAPARPAPLRPAPGARRRGEHDPHLDRRGRRRLPRSSPNWRGGSTGSRSGCPPRTSPSPI